ncbi:PREDICTED: pentatricopeptide [Prunus dulcis]|uniref:PREDICTED: pentatricopeptide n=1 Tax=Prunus dulcis TaxID=3755 RepID=A0A5E4G2Q5_PRUDU|nr:PREDICTED: pentatricopeptide [Prunus dulcis]
METLIQTRCKSGTLESEEALGYFNSMIQTKPIPSNWTFKCLFGALYKMKQYSALVSMYKQLMGCQFQPDVTAMNIFMNCLCRLNRVDLGFSVLALTFKYGLEPDAYSLNALLQGLCKNSALSEAVELFRKIEEKEYPDVVTYNTLIYGLCQSGKWEKAKSFLICMVDSGIPPDVYTYGVLISALCKEERIQEALALFEDMTGKGINPNVFIFNSLVSASCKCCKWEKAAQLFQNMIDCGSLPDIVTFNAVLDALCKEGKMTRRGQMPNLVTYNSLINGLCQSGQWREATKLLNKMMGERIPPGVVTLNIVIKYLCKNRRTMLELMADGGLKNLTLSLTTV